MFDALKRLIDNILLKFCYSKKEELMPEPLKNQIFHIISDTIGFIPLKEIYLYTDDDKTIISFYQCIIKSYCEELGSLYLKIPSWNSENYSYIFHEYFFSEKELKKQFLLIEKFFEVLRNKTYSMESYYKASRRLNKRFQEHLFGYKFERGKIIKYNSSYLQEEVVEPALKLINNETFAGAESEFRRALEDYKQDNNIAAINSCGRALENTIKIICDLNKWPYTDRDTTGKLLNICKDNKLFEDFFDEEGKTLVKILCEGATRLRNGKTGHGSGAKEKDVPDFYVDYMIHTTATVIIFLINANEYYQSKHP